MGAQDENLIRHGGDSTLHLFSGMIPCSVVGLAAATAWNQTPHP